MATAATSRADMTVRGLMMLITELLMPGQRVRVADQDVRAVRRDRLAAFGRRTGPCRDLIDERVKHVRHGARLAIRLGFGGIVELHFERVVGLRVDAAAGE